MTERSFSLTFLVLVFISVIISFQYEMLSDFSVVGAGFIPRIVTGTMFLLAIVYVWKVYNGAYKENEETKPSRLIRYKQLAFLLALLICLPLIEVFGMIVTLGLFLFTSLRYIEGNNLIRSVTFSAAISVGVFLLFETWLDARLPIGIFETL
ncbi:tripartite tricarboxylate transporter TctB family protein [Salicibibacter kimchii]|uniref:tripartite tricarboxylate transporter TctB family protein n=1 Tax=Salicibibacter kimchii TaxID=2099786 RepID=UPI0013580C36|nr:tripartite tricarboxylate transporter TctB family protein [Salicibibacter kimchii]